MPSLPRPSSPRSRLGSFLCLPVAVVLAAGTPGESDPETVVTKAVTLPVSVTFDERAVPSIVARDRSDAFAALGWLHATERFFQMDGLRRQAAGETAALAGPGLVALDRPQAIARRREFAGRVVASLEASERALLDAYVGGVNAGLDALEVAPIEHRLLNATPAPWTPEDSILAMLSMFDMLQRTAEKELDVAALESVVPPEVATWLVSMPGRWDTLLVTTEPNDPRERTSPLPPLVDARSGRSDARPRAAATSGFDDRFQPGSNSFAISGARTEDGRAIVANDPHLAIMAPAIWYRAAISWPGVRAFGLTLPGVPGLPIGLTDHLAWGLTNTTGDFEDLVIIEVDPEDPSRYRTPDGYEPFDDREVEIAVAGGSPVRVNSRFTRWGPVVDEMPDGRPLALLRGCDRTEAIDLGIVGLLEAKDVETALDIAADWGGPSQNVVVADADGRIGWTISGWIPNRVGWDGTAPVTHLDGRGWDGALPERHRPRVIDPPSGALQTANNRLVPMEVADRIGRAWANGDRAWRIARRLEMQEKFDERDLMAIQLDDVVPRFAPYRDLLLETWRGMPEERVEPDAIAIVEAWDERASTDDVALPVVASFRSRLLRAAGAMLLDRFGTGDDDPATLAAAARALEEEPVLLACEARDPRLEPPGGTSWNEVFIQAADAATRRYRNDPDTPWSERNRLMARHPLGQAHPLVGDRFDLPSVPQPGHWSAVRVSGSGFGASARFVASPGHWEDAILQTPGGQSGDPESAHYRDAHLDWAEGVAAPLLPGDAVRRIDLVPKG